MSDIEIHLFQKRKYNLVFLCFFLAFLLLTGRLIYLTIFRSEELSKRALSIEQRERTKMCIRDRVTGIDEEGFSYPLHQAALYNKESIGVSNEIVEKEATLRLQSGYLIVMRTTD